MKRLNEVDGLLITPAHGFTQRGLDASRCSPLEFYGKRVMDVCGSAFLLALLWPLLLVLALAVRLESPGPALYVQERVGVKRRLEKGRVVWQTCTFQLYKLRSMVQDADPALHQAYTKAFVAGQTEAAAGGVAYKLDRDPHITRVGSFLRRTSLDELPQLFNVLKGEMSLVGPRPVPVYEVAEYEPRHYARLRALPGITGLWQVKGRGRVTFEEMMRLDIAYATQQSLWLDLKLLWLTLPAVLFGRGAK